MIRTDRMLLSLGISRSGRDKLAQKYNTEPNNHGAPESLISS